MHSIVWLQATTKMSGIGERACIVSDSNGARWDTGRYTRSLDLECDLIAFGQISVDFV
jgi:hypothetical protein